MSKDYVAAHVTPGRAKMGSYSGEENLWTFRGSKDLDSSNLDGLTLKGVK